MKSNSKMSFVLAVAVLGLAEARISANTQAALAGDKINPPLKDVSSDKKFFGPPFPADYPDDHRPAVQKGILDKLKGPDQPYPALQGKDEYDRDYVKDENSDKGSWQAQFEYDTLRRKLYGDEEDLKRAQDRADGEGKDVDGAQHDADEAGKGVSDAEKGVSDASKSEEDIKKAEDFDGPPSAEKLEELKKAVKDAEERYEKQKIAFAKCEAELKAAEEEVASLKKSQAAMEEELAAKTKLWAEKKDAAVKEAAQIKLNLQKAKEDKQKTASAKVKAAQEKLDAAKKVKADMDKVLEKEQAEHNKAKQDLSTKKAAMDKVKKELNDATAKLQTLHGYKPAPAALTPTKSGAQMTSVLFSAAMIIAMQM